ncbi:synaptic vesicle membrane protein VAT-1 homolog-like [Daphnia carinata]|uniref:synaptic vesicle membrane protein VAT-1 homolog-like n=1 Tax=Daphnia carinata TaxID=120202 RepID=UPI002868B1A9|nr:synaptic vesicle membrane protein VAT-1 homolog-like [Daphnia carinata]
MFTEKHEVQSKPYRTLEPQSVSQTVSEHPTLIQNPPAGREQKGNLNEAQEIQREVHELRRRDEEEHRRKQRSALNRFEQHLNQNGGDLSPILTQPRLPTEMRCIQLTSFGLGKNINVAKIQLPLPMKHEVLIRSYCCGVNFNDIMTRNGMLDNWVRSLKAPFTMGSEVAGEIVGLGKNVTELNLGDRVMALPERRGWGEYVVCRVEHCFKIPDQMSYNDAVALTVDGIVAHSLLFQMGNLTPEKAILLHSTPGGLGNMVTQMASTVPDTCIFKIASEKEEGQILTSDQFVHYIGHDSDYVSEIRHSSPHGVDLVLDCQYEDNFHRDFNLLRPMGRYVIFGTQAVINRGFFDAAKSWWGQEKISPLKLYEENKSICGFNLRNLLYFQKDRPYVREVFCKICKMWQDGQIKPVVDSVIPFDDLGEALQRLQEDGQNGKIILDPTTTKERHEEPDYYDMAEKIVKQRHWDQKPFLNKLGLPEPDELVRDEQLVKEEQERAQREKREEIERKLREQQRKIEDQQQQYYEQELMKQMQREQQFLTAAPTRPAIGQQAPQFVEAQTVPQTYEVRTTSKGSGEPPIVYDPSSGKTIYNVTETVTTPVVPVVQQTTPVEVVTPVATTVTNVATTTEQLPSAPVPTTTETGREAILTKEKGMSFVNRRS